MSLSFLVSAVELKPFLLTPTYPDQSSCVLKGWLYSQLLYDFAETLLPVFEEWGRADQSWVIPAVSPSLGKTWVSPTTRILLSFIPICILPAPSCTETILCQLNSFSGHIWGAHKAVHPLMLTREYLSWLRPLKINKRTRSLVKWWDFRGWENTITQGGMDIMCWIRVVQR